MKSEFKMRSPLPFIPMKDKYLIFHLFNNSFCLTSYLNMWKKDFWDQLRWYYKSNFIHFSTLIQDRSYEKKKQMIFRFIKKHGRVDHSFILNEVNIDYDTLIKIISDLRKDGCLN